MLQIFFLVILFFEKNLQHFFFKKKYFPTETPKAPRNWSYFYFVYIKSNNIFYNTVDSVMQSKRAKPRESPESPESPPLELPPRKTRFPNEKIVLKFMK